ncbi:MAG: AAA family ATPase [bacterium]|nr:AAA family ATPase [bacterium]
MKKNFEELITLEKNTSKIELNEQFQKALYLLEKTNENIFITGKAGTGKSTLLTYFRKNTKKNLVVLAPTGVAALNVQGETIHSFFRFTPAITPEKAKKSAYKIKNNDFYKKIKTIVIDEISMVRADLLECIDIFLQTVLKKRKPFGGIQIIFIGDLYQLSPVVISQEKEAFNTLYESPYFFSASVIKNGSFKLNFIELEKIYRQSDLEFIELLNAIRNNSVNEAQLMCLNKQVNSNCAQKDNGHMYLTSTNKGAEEVNNKKLIQLKTKEYLFQAELKPKFAKTH